MLNPRLFSLALIGSCFLTACGSDPAEQNGADSPAVSASTPEASQDIIQMTAEDGWVDLHDLSLPEPGRAWLDIDGETVEFEIECYGPGVVDHSGEVPQSISSRLFTTEFVGEGTLANGRRTKIEGARYVVDELEMRRNTHVYSYRGMDNASLELTVFDQEGVANGSIQGGPSVQNRSGEGLPMLHVQPDGSFTATTELISKAEYIPGTHQHHQHALAGPITLAGRCSEAWEQLPSRYRW